MAHHGITHFNGMNIRNTSGEGHKMAIRQDAIASRVYNGYLDAMENGKPYDVKAEYENAVSKQGKREARQADKPGIQRAKSVVIPVDLEAIKAKQAELAKGRAEFEAEFGKVRKFKRDESLR